jgi:hypothetical protein
VTQCMMFRCLVVTVYVYIYGLSKGKGKGRFTGPIQHCGRKADCTLAPEIVPSFISRGAPHQAA